MDEIILGLTIMDLIRYIRRRLHKLSTQVYVWLIAFGITSPFRLHYSVWLQYVGLAEMSCVCEKIDYRQVITFDEEVSGMRFGWYMQR